MRRRLRLTALVLGTLVVAAAAHDSGLANRLIAAGHRDDVGAAGGGAQVLGASTSKGFTIEGVVEGLAPGRPTDLVLTIDNPSSRDIRVTELTVASAGTDRAGCAASLFDVPARTALSLVVNRRSRATVALAVQLRVEAPDACQGATFALAYGGTAVKP